MTDIEIEQAVTKAGGAWNGDHWKFEDADLHPFVRGLLAAERERFPNLLPVIQWLERGCDPQEAAKELRIYQQMLTPNVGVQPTEPAQLARVGCNDWLCRARAAEGTDRRGAQAPPECEKHGTPIRAAGVSWKQAKVCKESPLETILLLAFSFITWPG